MSKALAFKPPLVVTLTGDCGIANAEHLRAKLEPATLAESVVLDLSKATSIDSTALGMFVQVHKALHARTGEAVKIVTNNRRLRQVLNSTGLDRMFKLNDSSGLAE